MKEEELTRNFVSKICRENKIYKLQSEDGYAVSISQDYTFEDEDEEGLEMICFWSDEELAAKAAKAGWKNYQPEALWLNEFLEEWCLGMFEETIVAGLDYDAEMQNGIEILPLDLMLAILLELEKPEFNHIKFVHFPSVKEFRTEILSIKSELHG